MVVNATSGAGHMRDLLDAVRPPAAARMADVRARLDALAKPPGSLGGLEDIAARLACIVGNPPPPLHRRRVLVFAADHGVARRGVSAYPPDVTRHMCALFAAGGAAVNVLARTVGADVTVVDVGVDAAEPIAGVVARRVRRGTRDLADGPALTPDEVDAAFSAGWECARAAARDADIIALGEMGIANTTAAAAVTAALTGEDVACVVGTGTGIDAAVLARKRDIVARAVRRLGGERDPRAVLAEVGGLEIAALAGAAVGAAASARPVVTDGFIATAGVLAAARMCPAVADYVFASHLSSEPGHAVQLAALGLHPVLHLRLRLGEGTGAVLALPVIDAAGAVLREMATLEQALAASRSAAAPAVYAP
jgi:nicotinate-nucleotide--dimethylbenzimidazole phosphoribosyltransferase